MTIKLTSDNAAVVDTAHQWRAIDSSTPRSAKLQLISRPSGVAMYAKLPSGTSTFFTHWAPLPTFSNVQRASNPNAMFESKP